MESTFLPCGKYHEFYKNDHGWFKTAFIKGKMILLLAVLFLVIPNIFMGYWMSIFNMVGYTILGALGIQLLIGYCGQLTLGHGAFIAVGAYTTTMLILEFPWPKFIVDMGLAYPLSTIIAGVIAGLWSVIFGLPSARVKGFYLILTTMAAQFITVDFILTQYVSSIGGRGQAFSIPPEAIKIGPWIIDNNTKVYYFMLVLVILSFVIVANLLRSRVGRAWIAIRDNDISAEVMGINVIKYKLLAFFVAGFIAGICGAFWISNLAAVSPEHFEWFLSLWLVGVILIGGAGSLHGVVFGSIFMVVSMELLQMGIMPLAEYYPKLASDFLYIKESVFGLLICAFLIYEPNGMAYRWWQIKNYFNLWPFSY